MRYLVAILVLIVLPISACDSASDITHEVNVQTDARSYEAGDVIEVEISNGLSVDLSLRTWGKGRDFIHEVITTDSNPTSVYGQVYSIWSDSVLAQGDAVRYTIDSDRIADRVDSLPDTFMVRFMRSPGEIAQYRQLPQYFYSDSFVVQPK